MSTQTPSPSIPTNAELAQAYDAEIQELLRKQEERVALTFAERHEENLACEQARTRANRQNALHSTGPRTLSGKEISRLNAVRHGLTGRQILLPSEDADAYSSHITRFRRDHVPATERELELTQMLADTQWRLNRIPGLESAIYAMGRIRYVDLFLGVDDEGLRAQLIDCYTSEQSAKQLSNLSLQEGRLRRQYDKDERELDALQAERRELEKVTKPQVSQTQGSAATAKANTSDPNWVRFFRLQFYRSEHRPKQSNGSAVKQRREKLAARSEKPGAPAWYTRSYGRHQLYSCCSGRHRRSLIRRATGDWARCRPTHQNGKAFDNSKVMNPLASLTDRCGPRLTGSPEFEDTVEPRYSHRTTAAPRFDIVDELASKQDARAEEVD